MCEFDYLDNYIADFVDRHVSEKVKLNLTPKSIIIAPVKRKGSILLSMFWIKVLQHKRNFPPHIVSYNKKRLSNSEVIYIFVDGVMISLDLLTGLLEVEGDYALEWFRSRMMELIQNYIGVKKSASGDREFSYIGETSQSVNSSDLTTQNNPQKSKHLLTKLNYCEAPTVLEQDHLSNLMIGTVLESACCSISKSSLKPSRSWIYRFWKSLIYHWLNDTNISLVIACSKIDCKRWQDIADISLLLRATSQIQAIYVSFYDNDASDNLADTKKSALTKYNSNEQLWIEYEIFHKINIPRNGIGCNFLAGIMPDNRVQIMLTSSKFHQCDFEKDSLHSVQFLEMSEIQFDKDFISLLHN